MKELTVALTPYLHQRQVEYADITHGGYMQEPSFINIYCAYCLSSCLMVSMRIWMNSSITVGVIVLSIRNIISYQRFSRSVETVDLMTRYQCLVLAYSVNQIPDKLKLYLHTRANIL